MLTFSPHVSFIICFGLFVFRNTFEFLLFKKKQSCVPFVLLKRQLSFAFLRNVYAFDLVHSLLIIIRSTYLKTIHLLSTASLVIRNI